MQHTWQYYATITTIVLLFPFALGGLALLFLHANKGTQQQEQSQQGGQHRFDFGASYDAQCNAEDANETVAMPSVHAQGGSESVREYEESYHDAS